MGLSSVVTWVPPASPGGPLTSPRWLGTLGPVTGLKYGYKVGGGGGGPDKMSCTLVRDADYRTDALDQGRVAQVYRGGGCIWDGKLLEAASGAAGWQVSATGLANQAQDYLMIYGTWTNQNDAVNQAIARGWRITNPGIPGGVWLGQKADSASQDMAGLLDLFCTLGGYYWYVTVNPQGTGGQLNLVPFPQGINGPMSPLTPNRLMTVTTPVSRTLGNWVNTVYARYQSSADGATTATYALTSKQNTAQAQGKGPVEVFTDLSSAGVETAGGVQALIQQMLNRFIPVSYSSPFTLQPGQLMTAGGQPVDMGCEQAGTIIQALITDFGIGGDVVPGPVTFLVGGYEWDDDAEQATVTAYQSLDTSFSGMLGALGTVAGGSFRSRTGKTGFWGYGTAAQERQWAKAHAPKPRPKPRIFPGTRR